MQRPLFWFVTFVNTLNILMRRPTVDTTTFDLGSFTAPESSIDISLYLILIVSRRLIKWINSRQ
jgi:hypothetical protein